MRDTALGIVGGIGLMLLFVSSNLAQTAAEAVDLMFNAAGTTAIYASSRLERCFRDVHVATQHVAVAASNIEMVGQYSLGLGLQWRR